MAQFKDNKERRLSVRHPLKLLYKFYFGDDSYAGVTGNVSLTGVFLEAISPKIPAKLINETIELQLVLENKKFITSAKIVYISDPNIPLMHGVGIEFGYLSETMQKMLKNYLIKQTNKTSTSLN